MVKIVYNDCYGGFGLSKKAIQRDASLKFACETLGGVYVDSRTCIEGKNLFGVK